MMHKRLQGIAFKKRPTYAVRDIRRFAIKEMHTGDVRVDTQLNRFIQSKGCRNVPRRIRVRISRTKNEVRRRGALSSGSDFSAPGWVAHVLPK